MKQLIHEVIELDKKAQAEIATLKKEKDELFLAFKEMKKELTDQNKLETDAEIQKIEKELKTDFEKRLDFAQKKANEKEMVITSYYQGHKEQWLKELFDYITKE